MGDAPIYATSKSAVTTLTELLYYQLKTQTRQLVVLGVVPRAELAAHASVGGVEDAARRSTRRSVPRTPPYPTFEEFEAQMEAAGTPLPITPLEEVAARVLDAIRTDMFWINPGNDEPLDARYASMKARRNPDYFRNLEPDDEDVIQRARRPRCRERASVTAASNTSAVTTYFAAAL